MELCGAVWECDWERLAKQMERPQPGRGNQKMSDVSGPWGSHSLDWSLKKDVGFQGGEEN